MFVDFVYLLRWAAKYVKENRQLQKLERLRQKLEALTNRYAEVHLHLSACCSMFAVSLPFSQRVQYPKQAAHHNGVTSSLTNKMQRCVLVTHITLL